MTFAEISLKLHGLPHVDFLFVIDITTLSSISQITTLSLISQHCRCHNTVIDITTWSLIISSCDENGVRWGVGVNRFHDIVITKCSEPKDQAVALPMGVANALPANLSANAAVVQIVKLF